MAHLIVSQSERRAFLDIIKLIQKEGKRSSRYLELQNCLLSINHDKVEFEQFKKFQIVYANIIGDSAKSGLLRAKRVFEDMSDRVTKPSYLKRLTAFDEIYKKEIIQINQIENIAAELSIKPTSNTLSFNFFRPIDLIKKQRQGYVPCPLTGDFKFRKNKLHLNVFFRSQDIMNFFYPDVIYLRRMQKEVLLKAIEMTELNSVKKGTVGKLNFHYSRVYIPLSMEWTPKKYVNKKEIMSKISKLESSLKKSSKNWT